MTTILYDLRHAFGQALPSGASTVEQSADPDPSFPPADNDPASPPDDSAGEEGEGEDIKNPRIKELSEEARKHRLNAKAEKERADQAEAELETLRSAAGDQETVRALRLELAFLKANQARTEPFKDVDAAMKMADLGGVQVDEAGAVTGLDEAMDYVAKRYPYMVTTTGPKPPDHPTPTFPSGRMNNGQKKGTTGLDRATLEKRFPALRRGR